MNIVPVPSSPHLQVQPTRALDDECKNTSNSQSVCPVQCEPFSPNSHQASSTGEPSTAIQLRNIVATGNANSFLKDNRLTEKESNQAAASHSDKTPADNSEAPLKRKRGRPRKIRPVKVCKPKILVMKFLMEEACMGNFAQWEKTELDKNSNSRDIKVTDTEGLGKKWGELKQNPGMTYAKLTRGLRYYKNEGLIPNKQHKIFTIDLLHKKTAELWVEVNQNTTKEATTKNPVNETSGLNRFKQIKSNAEPFRQ